MSDSKANFLDTFPAWLRTLGDDAEKLSALIGDASLPAGSRQVIAGGLNYLFKSLDLIPDGIDDIGYLDDAFVLRVAADLAVHEGTGDASGDALREFTRLANDADAVREFLGKDYSRLETYVAGLRRGAARGRSVDDVVSNDQIRGDFLSDVRGFCKAYSCPSFAREEKTLIKLRAFFDAKLPR